jgi:sigma-B regulation protein RsbU (phosphoserine phosphatase)
MPPIECYQNKTGRVFEIESGGPPLGAFINYKYETYNYELCKGDIIVVMSDGFSERRNEKKELFGWNRVKEMLLELKDFSSAEIIKKLIRVNDIWGGDCHQDDDITFIVIKVI